MRKLIVKVAGVRGGAGGERTSWRLRSAASALVASIMVPPLSAPVKKRLDALLTAASELYGVGRADLRSLLFDRTATFASANTQLQTIAGVLPTLTAVDDDAAGVWVKRFDLTNEWMPYCRISLLWVLIKASNHPDGELVEGGGLVANEALGRRERVDPQVSPGKGGALRPARSACKLALPMRI